MRKLLASASIGAMAVLSAGAYAQEGTVAKAVGGYTFEDAAKEIGLTVAGHEGWDAQAPNYTALMTKIKATGADGIYIGGLEDQNGSQVVKDKVAVLGDNEKVKLVMADGMVTTAFVNVQRFNSASKTMPSARIAVPSA